MGKWNESLSTSAATTVLVILFPVLVMDVQG